MRHASRGLRATTVSVFVLAAACIGRPAMAQQRRFDIPATDVASALIEYGRQAGLQIVAPQGDLARRQAPALRGSMDAHEALRQLLKGTGLKVVADDGHTVTLAPDAAAVPATRPQAELPPVDPSSAPRPRDFKTLQSVSVIGSGSTRTTAAVTESYIQSQAPGVSGLNLLKDLPGVNVQTSDPYGLYELNNTLEIRGFSMSQIGMSLDGVPLETIDTHQGGPITRYTLSENTSDVEVSPGSGDVTQPSAHALGGSVRYFTTDPKQRFGGSVAQTVGSDNFTRSFFRIDTGQWWSGGPTAYVSGARTRGTSYENDRAWLSQDLFEAKVRQAWGENSITFAAHYSTRNDHDYQDYTIDMKPDTTPGGWHINKYLTGDPDEDVYYYQNWTNGLHSWLFSLNGDFALGDSVTLKVTPYDENEDGWAAYAVSPSNALSYYQTAMAALPGRTDIVAPNSTTALPLRKEVSTLDRKGVTAGLTWETDANTLSAGTWLEDAKYTDYNPLRNVDLATGRILYDELPIIVSYDRNFDTKAVQLYVDDKLKLFDDRLTLDAGAKGLRVKRHFWGIANVNDFYAGIQRDVDVTDKDWFQPQLGANYDLTDSTQLFVNYAQNFSATPTAAMVSVYFNPDIKPEKSDNIDLGVRTQHDAWSGYLALYKVDYKDRLVSLTTSNIQALQGSTYLNVGSVHTYGLELSGEWLPAEHWRVASSLSLNRSKFADDYDAFDSDGVQDVPVKVKGNVVPDQPKTSFSLSGNYDGTHFFASADVKYSGSRYADTINDLEVDGYTLFNASAGYKGGEDGPFAHMRFQLSVYNLFDKKYLSRISPAEQSATFKLGSPRTFYASLQYTF